MMAPDSPRHDRSSAIGSVEEDIDIGAGELESISVHVRGTDLEVRAALKDGPTWDCVDLGVASTAAESEEDLEPDAAGPSLERYVQLKRERTTLFGDLCGLKAKFDLTLETLRSIYRLESDATWVDILEHSEALAKNQDGEGHGLGFGGGSASDGIVVSDGEGLALAAAEEELRQAEMEWEHLEEKLTAQTAHNVRLRDILQKQQGLLDMTAKQLESQHEEIKKQTDRVAELEAKEASQDVVVAELELRVNAYQQDLVDKEEALMARVSECEEQQREAMVRKEAHENLCIENDRQRTEDKEQMEQLRAEVTRYRDESKELLEAFTKQEELVERLRSQLHTHEANDRRRHSYHPNASDRSIRDDVSDVCSSVGSARPSARGEPPRKPVLLSSKPSKSTFEDMGKEERDAFLSHFPMASRTEKSFRNRADDKVPAPSMSNR